MVLEGEMRHTCKTLLTFTRPYLGTASSMSKTLAVSMYSGGSSSSTWMLDQPAFRSRLSAARFVLISFARWRASMRWTRERSGAAVVGLAGVFVAGGMGGESTALAASDKGRITNIGLGELEVHISTGVLTRSRWFAGLLLDTSTRHDRASRLDGLELPAYASTRNRVPERLRSDRDQSCARTQHLV